MAITMTTWNIQNFSQEDDVYAQKLDFLSDTLQSLGSDVVALQEVLDLNALQDLANRLGFHICRRQTSPGHFRPTQYYAKRYGGAV